MLIIHVIPGETFQLTLAICCQTAVPERQYFKDTRAHDKKSKRLQTKGVHVIYNPAIKRCYQAMLSNIVIILGTRCSFGFHLSWLTGATATPAAQRKPSTSDRESASMVPDSCVTRSKNGWWFGIVPLQVKVKCGGWRWGEGSLISRWTIKIHQPEGNFWE